MSFYNDDQPHQALSYKTPSEVNKTGVGVGAMMLNKFGKSTDKSAIPLALRV